MSGASDTALPQADLHLLSPQPGCTCLQCPQAKDTGQPFNWQGLPALSSQCSLQRSNVKLHPFPPALLPAGPGRTCPPLVSLPRVPVAFGMTVTPFAGLALCYLHRDVSKKRGEWCSCKPAKPTGYCRILKAVSTVTLGPPRGCMLHLHMDTCYSQLKLQTLESQRATGKDFAA